MLLSSTKLFNSVGKVLRFKLPKIGGYIFWKLVVLLHNKDNQYKRATPMKLIKAYRPGTKNINQSCYLKKGQAHKIKHNGTSKRR